MKTKRHISPPCALLFALSVILFAPCSMLFAQGQPNILYLITDDHRADALECYNRATIGQSESQLGYVSSPNIDKLADQGVLFTNVFCNSPACGPSRGSIISGRYPFRNGHYAFELSHQNPDYIKPTFPQILREQGYQTAQFGKTGEYIYKWGPGMGFYNAEHYDYMMHFKHDLQKNFVGDLWNHPVPEGTEECVVFPDGRRVSYLTKRKKGEVSEKNKAKRKQIEDELDILRAYSRSNPDLIIGGVNSMPAGKTVDGMVVEEFKKYLNNANGSYTTSFGEEATGANTNKPQLLNLGFHLPHTPVLPPKKFRDIFKKKNYQVPEFSEEEYHKMPAQMQDLHRKLNMTNMRNADKQQAIQDYYAFCAYGDALIGDAVKAFQDYCKKHRQEYLIIFVVGDHGWHLGEQGIEAKFGPWAKSTAGAMIMVASDKSLVPESTVKDQLLEYVDVAPTILYTSGVNIKQEKYDYLDGFNLLEFTNSDKEKRDYILGEINLVAGHRAYLRSNDFAFSMQTRPHRKGGLNEDIKWAMTCPAEDASLALYDLRNDPNERNNVANDPAYAELTAWFRNKLGNIVLGDGRAECDWSKPNTYALSNFAAGTDDKKLDIPQSIIPNVE